MKRKLTEEEIVKAIYNLADQGIPCSGMVECDTCPLREECPDTGCSLENIGSMAIQWFDKKGMLPGVVGSKPISPSLIPAIPGDPAGTKPKKDRKCGFCRGEGSITIVLVKKDWQGSTVEYDRCPACGGSGKRPSRKALYEKIARLEEYRMAIPGCFARVEVRTADEEEAYQDHLSGMDG